MNQNAFHDNNFTFLRTVLTIIGCWPFYKTEQQKNYQNIRKIALIMSISAIFCSELMYIVQDSINSSLFDIIENISLTVTAVISLVKLICHLINRSKMIQILENLEDLSSNTPIPDNKEVKTVTKIASKQSQFISKLLFSTCFGCVCIYAIRPGIIYYKNNTFTLPYSIKLPFDIDSLALYLPIYATEVISSCGVTIIFVGDTLFSTIILFVCTRIDVLKYSLDKSVEESKKTEIEGKLFKDCVEYHKKILKYAH